MEKKTPKNQLKKKTSQTSGEDKLKKSSEGEKTPEQIKKIISLQKQKEHQRIKREEAEERAREAEEEVRRLKKEKESSTLSEGDLIKLNPNYEFMDESEKTMYRKQMKHDKEIDTLKAQNKWNDDYKNLPSNVRAKIDEAGGEQAFKRFACSEENRGQKNLGNLAVQFLGKNYPWGKGEEDEGEDKGGEDKSNPPPKEPESKTERPGLEPGSGGSDLPPYKPKEGYTLAELKEMRLKNPRLYAKLAREKKLKIKEDE